ncbi:Zinc-finger homeodomain protein 12 [Hirschfeldia incana]|nr:Zinc-finger homeodomain protein 12 [Hirschfeldia incana]
MGFMYNECLKNQAVSFGGYALDGCGEFMPKSTTILTDPPSLSCDACGCHRNFHRRDHSTVVSHRTTSPLQPAASTQHLLLSLSSSGLSGPSDQEKGKTMVDRELMTKRRKRTKFTVKQKVMMRGFAERAGWKINGCDDDYVREFCSEVGVEREVLKVWIHNNKYFANGRNRNTTSSMFQKL